MTRPRFWSPAFILAPAFLLLAPRAQDANVAIVRAYLSAKTPAGVDVDARANALLAVAAQHARAPVAVILINACQEFVPQLRDPGAFAAAARELLEVKDLHGASAVAAIGLATHALSRAGRTDEAMALMKTAGMASAVLVFGPFGDDGDNYLGTPFALELGLEAGLDAVAKLPGRFGVVEPRVARYDAADYGRIALRDPRTGDQGCFYALHQPAVEQALACYLELWAPGSCEVFVNGARTATHDGFADPSSATHWLPIVLRKGTNHVLLKTALNGYDRVALRYVDGAGRNVGVREPDAPERIAAAAAAADNEPPTAPAFVSPLLALDRAARAATGDDALALRLACALDSSTVTENRRVLEHVLAVEQANPTSLDLRLALANAYDHTELLPEELRRSRARAVLDGIDRDALEEHAWAIEQRAQHLADEDKVEEAIRLLQAAVDAKRAGPSLFARLHGFYEKLEFRAEASKLRSGWLQLYPGDTTAVNAEVNERQREGDLRGVKELLIAARAVARGDAGFSQRLMNVGVDLRDSALALAAHADLYAGRPKSAHAARALAEVHLRLGNRAEATRAFAALAAHGEATTRDLTLAGQMLLQLGADLDAKAVLAASLQRDASQHAVRKLLGRLHDQADDYPAFARFRRDVQALAAAFKPGEGEKDAASTLLLDQMIVEILDDGSSVEEITHVRRINDLSGVEKYQDADDAGRADELVALYTITAQGQRYVPHRVSGKFSMPRLAPGVFVVETWRRLQSAPGAAPWRGPEFHFQSTDEPYALSELVVIVPKDGKGSFRARNFDGPPEVKPLDDGRVAHVFARTDVPRLMPENLSPSIEEVVPVVTWGQDRTPGAGARRARDYLSYRLRSSTLVEAKAQELTSNLKGDLAKLNAIHGFVHDTIPTSNGTADPTAVLLRKQGPRFWLELALLRAAGVPLRLATAARTIDALRDEAPPLFFGETEYGVDAARVEPQDGHAVWLFEDDPRYWPLYRMASDRMGAPALLLDAGGWTPTHVTAGNPASEDGFEVRGEVALDAKGTATFRVRGTLRGREGFAAADQLREREDNIRKLAARQVASQVLEGWAPKSVDLVVADKTEPLGLVGELIKRRAVSAAGDVSLLDLPLGKHGWLAAYGDRAERKQPLALTSINAASWEVTIDPGQAFRITELPADTLVRHALIEYAQTFRLVDGKLTVRREYLQRPGRLEPALFGEWLDLLRRLDLAEETKVKLAAR